MNVSITSTKTNAEEVSKEIAEESTELKELEESILMIPILLLSKRLLLKELWEPTAEELQEDNVKTTRLAESELEDKSKEEKEDSEELHWRLVDVNPKRDQTDVQEDVWEEHADLVQEENVLERKKLKDVSESEPEDTEESTAQEESEELEDSEEELEEKSEELQEDWESTEEDSAHTAEELQEDNAKMIRLAESE